MEQALEAFQGTLINTKTIDDYELVEVDPADLPPEEVSGFRIEGSPKIEMRVVWVSEDRRSAATVERVGPCKVVGTHGNEVFYILEGGWTATRPDGSSYELKAGDFACYSEGQREEAVSNDGFLKVAFYNSSKPLPYEVTR